MIHTIRWMVRREPQERQPHVYTQVLVPFLLGGLMGGAAAGLLVALVARVLFLVVGSHLRVVALVSSLVALAYLGQVLGIWRLPRLSVRHQVPRAWQEMFRAPIASFLYSAGLGLTFFTRISSTALYPFVAVLLGLGQWPWAVVLLFALSGLMRASTALLVPARHWEQGSTEAVDDELKVLSLAAKYGRLAVLTAATMIFVLLIFTLHG
jgi:hypothetical protein